MSYFGVPCDVRLLLFCWCIDLTGSSNIIAQPNYGDTTSEYSAVDFMCSNDAYYLDECNFRATNESVCQSHQYDAYLTCEGMFYIPGTKKLTSPVEHMLLAPSIHFWDATWVTGHKICMQ